MTRKNIRRWLASLGAASVVGAGAIAQAGLAQAQTGPRSGSAYAPTGTTLTFGMHGPAVLALQQRLAFLHYYPGKINGKFGWATMEAVWAFKEVQTGKLFPRNPNIVGPAMQRELVKPKLPPVLHPHGGATRIEINKRIEVLVVYHRNKPVLISHTSTAAYYRPDGRGWVTPDGVYRAWEFLPGPVADASFGGYMYNPVFFIGTSFAIHGMPDPTSTISDQGVPLNPASHGCVRIPMDVSLILHKLIHVSATNGTKIYINGPNYKGSI